MVTPMCTQLTYEGLLNEVMPQTIVFSGQCNWFTIYVLREGYCLHVVLLVL